MTPKQKRLIDIYNNVSMDFFDQSPKVYKDILNQNNNALWYNNLGVNHEGGNRLFKDGSTFRASKIKLYATDVYWKFARHADALITEPSGLGVISSDHYKFETLPMFSIVLYQPNNSVQMIKAVTPYDAQIMNIDPNYDVYITVNDQKGHYHDNSGAFDLYLEILV